MKFNVTLTRNDELTVEISADTPEEAEETALNRLYNGELRFDENLENVESESKPVYTQVSIENAAVAKWLYAGHYGILEERERDKEYIFYLYLSDFGDRENEIDGYVGYGKAATFHMSGFSDPQNAFETAAEFLFSKSFPCSDVDLDRKGENIFWRVWTPDNSESWHIFTRIAITSITVEEMDESADPSFANDGVYSWPDTVVTFSDGSVLEIQDSSCGECGARIWAIYEDAQGNEIGSCNYGSMYHDDEKYSNLSIEKLPEMFYLVARETGYHLLSSEEWRDGFPEEED